MQEDNVVVPISELLARRLALGDGNRTAFADDRQRVSYAWLVSRTRRLAGHLLDRGIARQERFLIFLENSVEVAEGYLAAPLGGFVTVCANPQSSGPEIAHIIADSSPRAVLTDSPRLSVLASLNPAAAGIELIVVAGGIEQPDLAAIPGVDVVAYDSWISEEPAHRDLPGAGLEEWCWMLYTSGTTGKPKGVKLNQRGCLWVAGSCWIPIAGLNRKDTLLNALPLFHSYALVLCVVAAIASGASVRLLPKFSRTQVERLLREETVTFLPGVPTMFHYLLQGAQGPKLDAPNLRLCVSAGALMQPSLNREFEEFAGVPLLDGYGITETSTMVTMNLPHGQRPLGSCGRPLPGLTVRLVDPVTGKDAPEGEAGEIWVRGPNVMLGYHNRPDADAEVLVDGWYRTGDIARRDPDGFVFITGRIKEMIIRGAENIYPAEIEAVLLDCSGVADAAVVGIAHESLGEVPVAFVVAEGSGRIDRVEILRACQDRLSSFKVPVDVIQVEGVPRTASGKIQRFKLRSLTGRRVDAP